MATLPDDSSIEQKLSAFADGELDAAQRLEVLDYLAAHPDAMETVRNQQRIMIAAQRVLDDATVKAPPRLRERIAGISTGISTGTLTVSSTTAPAKPWRIMTGSKWSMAIAACLLIAVGIAIERAATQLQDIPSHDFAEPVIPASMVAHASSIHAYCSRLAEGLHAAGYPQNQGDLAADVEHDLHSSQPYPNLSSIGFHYVGAGPCGDAVANTIHLLYRSSRPGSLAAISVFVQPFHNQFPLELGRVYDVSGPSSPFPVLSWRTDQVIYFLIADNDGLERKALAVIRGDIDGSPYSTTTPSH